MPGKMSKTGNGMTMSKDSMVKQSMKKPLDMKMASSSPMKGTGDAKPVPPHIGKDK